MTEIVLGTSTALFAGLVLWLITGRMERVERDVKEKVEICSCKLIHGALEQLLEHQQSKMDLLDRMSTDMAVIKKILEERRS